MSPSSSSRTPDYIAAAVPPETPPSEYSYVERRADLLDHIIAAGSPRAIHQAEMAERYGVSESQISQDMDALAEDVAVHLADDLDLATRAAYQHVYEQLLREGQHRQAWLTHLDWVEFVTGRVATDEADEPVVNTEPYEGGLTPEQEAVFDQFCLPDDEQDALAQSE